MLNIGIIGGETHIGELTALEGKSLKIVGAAVRPDQTEWARELFHCPVVNDYRALLAATRPDVVVVANENDLKADAVLAALTAGCDVVVDKPMAITLTEQQRIEGFLAAHPERRLLMLLTLRGRLPWTALRDTVRQGGIGVPAFTHVRMGVQLKRSERPPWFLDVRRSGGMFLDLLVHGLDLVEWLTGRRIVALTATTGNLSATAEPHLRDHATVYCELDNGTAAVVEGQRMLPDTKSSDYRVTVAGTLGVADLTTSPSRLTVTSPAGADIDQKNLSAPLSVVEDWLARGNVVDQEASLRANRLAILATLSAEQRRQVDVT